MVTLMHYSERPKKNPMSSTGFSEPTVSVV